MEAFVVVAVFLSSLLKGDFKSGAGRIWINLYVYRIINKNQGRQSL